MTPRSETPYVGLDDLDEVWLQVGGTLCNLACNHCFISCHPGNRSFGFLHLDDVRRHIDDAVRLGVKEFYFTGGEPFLNKELVPMLRLALRRAPATVLTNGTVFTRSILDELADAARASRYSLELRVSLDGPDAATNDPIRGEGTFEQTMRGVEALVAHRFLPIITVTQTWPHERTEEMFAGFVAMLRRRGYERPRIKILPTLHIGMEEKRSRPYLDAERVTSAMLEGFDTDHLLCSHSRTVTDRGVAVCPILVETPGSHLGSSLEEAARPFAVEHGACHTCYVHGAICSNASASLHAGDR